MITHSGQPEPRAQGPDVTRSLLHLVGQTPLLELSRISEPGCARIWVKIEYLDPSGSGKDRDRTTARELLAQAGPTMAAFVAGVGTGGTLVGVAERLRRDAPDTRIVAVEPETSAAPGVDAPGFHGPKRFCRELVDEILTVSDDEAMTMARRLAIEEAIFGGLLSGTNVAAAVRIARDFPAHRAVVTLIPDHGLQYRSTDLRC
jgi:cysteine synthase